MKRYSLFLLAAALSLPAAYSQEVRANLTGIVADSSGAPIPNASITVTNLAQNATLRGETNETGNYVVPNLPPGLYRMTVEKQGFKRFVRENIRLEAQSTARVDARMEIGELTQNVTVEAAVSPLVTESASRSQLVASELVANVPTQGRNPFQIAWATPGVIKTGDWRYLRSFDIAGTSGFSVNGGRNRENEVLLDGISNVRGNRTVIHVPTMETVQEFRVLTNIYDSQYGRTGGGVVSIVTKSGGNQFHGNAFEYFQAEELNANQSELNRGGVKKPPMNINTFGLQASGPVWIPKVFDGRNRLFWLVGYEGMRQRSADPGTTNFPLMEWRGGDFTSLRNGQGQPVTIYDPLTTQRDGTRQPFAGNRLPPVRLNRIATEVLKFYPAPTGPGEGPAAIRNYIYPSRWIADMDQWVGRADWVINERNNFYFRYGQNPFSEYRGLVWLVSNPAEPTGNAPLIRNGRNWTFDWTSTLTPRIVFNLRTGLARWEETTGNSFGAGFNPTQLGFDQALVSQFSRLQFPYFQFGGNYQAIGSSRLLALGTDDSYTVQPNLSMVVGKHFVKFGGEGRRYNDNSNNPGLAAGSYDFRRNWTQANANQADAVSGNELASFLLGYPFSASVDRNIDPAYSNFYYAGFVQDDWKLSQRLSLNVGLRWDYEAPVFERYNRQLRGMDFNAASPIASRVQGLSLKGAIQFAGTGGQPRGAFERDRNNWQPRVGVAYRLTDKWVLRGGYGLYSLGQNEAGAAQGFSRGTSAITTTDNLTPAVTLANPFANLPGGRLLDPIGASLGAASFLGEGVTVNYLNRPLPYSHQYSFDIQRELPGNMLAEVGYVGNVTKRLPVAAGANFLPAEVLGRRAASGAIDTAWYNERVANPMAGLIPNNAALNGATIPRQTLLVQFPQYSGLGVANVPIGSQRHDGVLFKLTKRLSSGLSFLASYGITKTLEQVSLVNAQDFALGNVDSTRREKRSSNQLDIPQKFTIVGIYELPFGKGKPFAANVPKGVDLLVGGWQLNFDLTYQSGWTLDYPNAAQVKTGSTKLESPTIDRAFDTSFWINPATSRLAPSQEPFTLRNFPTRFSDVRFPGYQNWDASVSKYFPIREQVRLQFRFEMINAFNHPWFTTRSGGTLNVTSADFGKLNATQRNLPRFLKLALNLSW